jgi:DHA2 family multidrug resistance protein-like MFS transporter
MGPPALAMLIGAIGAPLLADRVPPGVIMAGTLALSLAGYGLLASAGTDSRPAVVAGFALVYLGLGVIAALGTEIVMGAAPPDRSGSAAALSETVQEFGIAAGVALLGSLTTAIYRRDIEIPAGLSASVAETYGNSLSGASSVADRIPADAFDYARSVFTGGLNTAALVAGMAIAFASAACFVMLRHIRPPDKADHAAEPIASTPGSNR